MIFKHLIEPEQLLSNRQPEWVVIDCRFDLVNSEWGFQDYLAGHIPGAIYAHLNHDLSGIPTEKTGRHPLPDPIVFANQLTSWGIEQEQTQVIVYDTTGGSFAGRLWWLLRYYGHRKVAVLDGGFPAWVHESLPVRTGPVENRPTSTPFLPTLHSEMMIPQEKVEEIYIDPAYVLIDARSPIRFRGESEPIDPIAGHIPGALNRFHGDNLTAEGYMKSPSILRNEFSLLLHGVPLQNTFVYCGSGVTSCLHILAMEVAGYSGVRLYPGSWSEWIRNPAHPVAITA